MKKLFFYHFILLLLTQNCENYSSKINGKEVLKKYITYEYENELRQRQLITKCKRYKTRKDFLKKCLEYYYFMTEYVIWRNKSNDFSIIFDLTYVSMSPDISYHIHLSSKYEDGKIYLYWLGEEYISSKFSYEEMFPEEENIKKPKRGDLFAILELVDEKKLKVNYFYKDVLEKNIIFGTQTPELLELDFIDLKL